MGEWQREVVDLFFIFLFRSSLKCCFGAGPLVLFVQSVHERLHCVPHVKCTGLELSQECYTRSSRDRCSLGTQTRYVLVFEYVGTCAWGPALYAVVARFVGFTISGMPLSFLYGLTDLLFIFTLLLPSLRNPELRFSEHVQQLNSSGSEWQRPFSLHEIDSVDPVKALEMYRPMFAHPSEFSFVMGM